MKILFVCTGNQCRSPMGEHLMRLALEERQVAGVSVASAGTLRLPPHPIDPSAGALLERQGIDASTFRSTPLTAAISGDADLILCFEHRHVRDILQQSPAARRMTFLLTDFADLCRYAQGNGQVKGDSPGERLAQLEALAPLARPFLPVAEEIEDPIGRSMDVFERVFGQIARCVEVIVGAIAA